MKSMGCCKNLMSSHDFAWNPRKSKPTTNIGWSNGSQKSLKSSDLPKTYRLKQDQTTSLQNVSHKRVVVEALVGIKLFNHNHLSDYTMGLIKNVWNQRIDMERLGCSYQMLFLGQSLLLIDQPFLKISSPPADRYLHAPTCNHLVAKKWKCHLAAKNKGSFFPNHPKPSKCWLSP